MLNPSMLICCGTSTWRAPLTWICSSTGWPGEVVPDESVAVAVASSAFAVVT